MAPMIPVHVAVLAALLALGLPGAAILGTVVMPGDHDAVLVYDTSLSGAAFAFIDEDLDGTLGAQEPVYLDVDGNGVISGLDVYVWHEFKNAGTHVAVDDANVGLSLTKAVELAYVDLVEDGSWTRGDTMLLSAQQGGVAVAHGDVILSGGNAGERVSDTSELANLPVSKAAASIDFVDLNANHNYDVSDALLLNMVGRNGVAPGDVVLTAFLGYTFGSVVSLGDAGVMAILDPLATGALENAGIMLVNETIVIDLDGGGTVSALDIRLGSATAVREQDKDIGQSGRMVTSLLASGEALVALDMNADSYFSPGDFRIAPAPSGWADRSTARIGSGLSPLQMKLGFADAHGNGDFTDGDPVYLNVDDSKHPHTGTGSATMGDVRLTPMFDQPGGHILEPGDVDALYWFGSAGPPLADRARFGFVDADSDGLLAVGEPVFLTVSGANEVRPGDLRIVSPAHSSGTIVRPGDDDVGAPIFGPARFVAFHDADGGGAVSAADSWYLDGDRNGAVSRGDVVLGGPYGGFVQITDHPTGHQELMAHEVLVDYVDVNRDQAYGQGDLLYVDLDDSVFVSIGDVRLFAVLPAPDGPLDEPSSAAEAQDYGEADNATREHRDPQAPPRNIPGPTFGLAVAALMTARAVQRRK